MTYLSLSLLGPFQAWTANGSLQTLRTLKERALLAYLAVENNHAHRREVLAELFWPDRPEGVARNNLRQALYGIRQAVSPQSFDALFYVSAEEVQVNFGDMLWLDINAFEVHLNTAREHNHHLAGPCPYCIQHLRDAVELYRGGFLEDVFLDKNPGFRSWVTQRHERYASLYAQALEVLIQNYERMEDYAQAAFYARRQVQLDDMKEYQQRRLMALLARNGRQGEALERFESYRHLLADSLGAEPDEQTQALAIQIRDGYFDLFASPAHAVPHNLPEQLTPFIGRDTELVQLTRLLENPTCRLVSLVGLAGVGKTRLALQATHLNMRLFADGIYYVTLDSVSAASQLGEAIGRTVGLVPGGQHDMRDLLVEYLHLKRVLIILDNFEHLLDGRDFLLDLLQNLPFLKLLITSRERLALQAEYLVELRGLPFWARESEPQTGEEWSAAARSDAVRLLYERASRVRPDAPWEVSQPALAQDGQEAGAALRICQLVDGLPLAIELAASWARDYSFQQIAEEVQRSLEFLQTTLHDVPERHRSLRASFEHSWEMLAESEQEVFCRLAVFPGSFSPAAAQEIASAAMPWLLRLKDKSLVRRTAYGRFDLHPLIRQFAGQKLRQYSRKVEDAAHQQHAQYFCAFLRERENQIKGQRQVEALSEVETELENITAAWEWAAEHCDTGLLENAAYPLMLYYESRSRWQEGEERFMNALAKLSSNGGPPAANRLRAVLMSAQGWFCCRLSRFQQADELLSASLQLMEKSEVSIGLVFTHFAYGFLCVWQSRFEEARTHLLTSLTLSQRIHDTWGEAWSRQLLTEITFESGQLQLEMNGRHFHETLAMFERLGEKRGSSRALNYLGNIAMAQGRQADARAYFEKMMANVERLGDVWGMASGYSKLGQLASDRGEYEQALRLHERGLNMLRKMGDQRRAAYTMRQLGDIAVVLGHAPEAEKYYRLVLETAVQTQSAPLAEDVLVSIAALFSTRGQAPRAVALLQQVLSSSLGDPFTLRRANELLESLAGSGEGPAAQEEQPARLWESVNRLLQPETTW